MGKLEEISKRNDELKGEGDNVVADGNQKLEEAQEFKGALDGLDIFDEDAGAIQEAATESAKEVASEQAENTIEKPMDDVTGSFTENAEAADTYSGTERENANKVSDAVGDYSSVGSTAQGEFNEHANQFEEARNMADNLSNEFSGKANDMVGRLEGMF